MEVPSETCRAVSRYKLCNVASSWMYSRIHITFVHPTLGLDLTLSDYYCPFAALKRSLGGHKFEGNSDVETVITRWLITQAVDLCQQL